MEELKPMEEVGRLTKAQNIVRILRIIAAQVGPIMENGGLNYLNADYGKKSTVEADLKNDCE